MRGFPKLSRRAEAGGQNKIFIEAVILKFGLVIFFNISLFFLFSTLQVTVGTCCRGGFRRAFLSEGHGTAMRESAVGVPPNPALQYVLCYGLNFIQY
ncbi:MAG: hypothetical protein A2W95_04675 [Bacteroidetes bacterium GWA2_40_14]|nr:MAG: hypothetical protein A2W95_04675 [Bacteroidetes bacterium GWA2_40_14]